MFTGETPLRSLLNSANYRPLATLRGRLSCGLCYLVTLHFLHHVITLRNQIEEIEESAEGMRG